MLEGSAKLWFQWRFKGLWLSVGAQGLGFRAYSVQGLGFRFRACGFSSWLCASPDAQGPTGRRAQLRTHVQCIAPEIPSTQCGLGLRV